MGFQQSFKRTNTEKLGVLMGIRHPLAHPLRVNHHLAWTNKLALCLTLSVK